ncbi:MAG: adenylate/guanylate cyclase domain-containing response regulator [Syntrophus sp. (in: bacteria)]|nr:adenylate/guanylate cyclase domain-containing response regulator [Syntrophus sp. (in: bacteria)]
MQARGDKVGDGEARILVVDDIVEVCELLSRCLEDMGFHSEKAENGQVAMQKLAEKPFDLVLLDIVMPDIDGYQVLSAIKSDIRLCHVPVIVISAIDEIDSIARCIELGAEDYLPKPFDLTLLKARIGASLERKRLRDQEQTLMRQIELEQQKSNSLLLNIMPESIAIRLKAGEQVIADTHDAVTVMFTDIVNFTNLSKHMTAQDLVQRLNFIISKFDALAIRFGVEKIKTIGDSVMLVCGMPLPNVNHARIMAKLALTLQQEIRKISLLENLPLELRIGIHSGPVVAGVLGLQKLAYDLWGETVNIASRMESQGLPGKIQVSDATYRLIKNEFIFEERARIDIRGVGEMTTYFVVDEVNPGQPL